MEAIEVIRQMAGRYPDEQIAATLNRLGLKTGSGNTWNEVRIRIVRSYNSFPAYDPKMPRGTLTLEEASGRLRVSHKVVRRLIEGKIIAAMQVVPYAPWEIPPEAIQSEQVLREVASVKRGPRIKLPLRDADLPMFDADSV